LKVTARSPETILFDWDGTLCDSGAASLRAFRKSLGDFGFEFTDDEYRTVYTPRWYHMYEAFKLPREIWKQADQRWLHHYGDETPGLVPGAAEVLTELARQGIRTGVVTNGTRPRIERELARMCLTDAFHAVVCHEDVTHSKPHPEGVLKALELAGCTTSACWYVGDTPVDIEQGHSAGVFTVGVVTGYVAAERIEQTGPNLILHSIAELPDALYRLTSTDSSKIPGGS
jgi:HAD superfamily hydrolase (TIGR01549 family)